MKIIKNSKELQWQLFFKFIGFYITLFTLEMIFIVKWGKVNYFWNTFFLFFYIINSYVNVPFGHARILINRFTESEVTTLGPGNYLFIFFWFRYKVSEPMIVSLENGQVYLYPKDEENKNRININFDMSRNTFRQREIGMFEDFSREFLIPWLLSKSLWRTFISLLLALIMGLPLAYVKNEYFVKENNYSANSAKSKIEKSEPEKVYVYPTFSDTTAAVKQEWKKEEKNYSVDTAPKVFTEPTQSEPEQKIRHKTAREVYAEMEERESQTKAEVINYVENGDFVFIPHLIFQGYPPEHVRFFLLPGYTLQGFYPDDGRFVITNSFGSQIDERECFRFIFCYQGYAFWSDSRRLVEDYDEGLLKDKEASKKLSKEYYYINNRAFRVSDGKPR